MSLTGRIGRRSASVRSVAFLALVALLTLTPAGAASAAAPRTAAESAAEQEFTVLANSARGQAGLSGFTETAGWRGHARDHSDDMAASNSIFHDGNLGAEAATLDCWVKVGENVGRGPSAGAIHNGLMNSPTHRANILGEFDGLAVGVKISAEGTVYVTQRFLKSCAAPAAPPAPASVGSVPAPTLKSTAAAPAPAPVEPAARVERVEREQRLGGVSFDIGI